MKVPSFLLKRLYVEGSLRNTGDGWGFILRNSIASGEATHLEPLTLDGVSLDSASCFFHMEQPIPFSAVGEERPFGLESGRDIEISVRGGTLPPGRHSIGMAFEVPVIGRLSFEFTDEVT